MYITVGNLKGGVGKSTTAMFLAWLLSDGGREPTAVVDADPLSQSAFDWYNIALDRGVQLPFPVFPWASRDVGRRIKGLKEHYRHIVVDTGGEDSGLFTESLREAGNLIIPTATSEIELRRLPATFEAATDVDQAGFPVYPWVLLVKVKTGAGDGPAARKFLVGEDRPVMESMIKNSVHYERSFGYAPEDVFGEYAGVLAEVKAGAELIDEEGAPA